MRRALFLITGILFGLMGIAQILMLAGVFGTQPVTMQGTAFGIMGLALSVGALRKAFRDESPGRLR